MDPSDGVPPEGGFFHPCDAYLSQRTEYKAQGSTSARKAQKADREKMRRDKLNEQFLELGNALGPDHPRNDKATILGDTIQMLKDLTSQVKKLKTEYTSLSEEAHELSQEKNELRDEKASMKSEVDNLNNQYLQRMRVLYPWAGMEPSVVVGPPPWYPYPVPVPISGAVPMHLHLQAYPLFHSQTSGAIPNACTPYLAYTQPCRPPTNQPSTQLNTEVAYSSSHRCNSPAPDCRSKSSTLLQPSCGVRSGDIGDVATDLELKTPGSSGPSLTAIANKCMNQNNGSTLTEGSSSSRCSSSGPPDVSNSVGDG
ncbi:hypothetical protein BS78_04G132200 [Paspalum vaginatum]|nr:hypothetical protein BS78_04G132200 [Paspalum vaginatum]KAJ1279134.1 hypothetical protein BS78_04G132200 [Paspalum vaginatum]KAJ1279135.1 hypothetical protein BS78_04G132200 [Paspalum vaginatum]KAJ1279136.1 hypothetical protein BS78_04G132200 [Paspalum vaginatum]KAJ1279138.1 hypothetical protein BS78_04G132200 [Paspalum vaginatum]